jgi:lipoprotein-anchoring transpeptidase ErfK/SrfK
MDSFKTVVIVGVLAAIAYGVYVGINNNPQLTPPPGAAEGWASNPPNVQLGSGSESPSTPFGSAARSSMAGRPPAMSIPTEIDRPSAPEPFESGLPASAAPRVGQEYPPRQYENAGQVAGEEDRSMAAMPRRAELPAERQLPTQREFSVDPTDSTYPPVAADDVSREGTARLGSQIGSPTPGEVSRQFAELIQEVRGELDRGHFAEMHETLSAWYGEPRLTGEEQRQLVALLDQVAGTVVYSRQHLIEPAYRVQAGDTLEKIAQAYDVSEQLLAKINGIGDPAALRPGDELKVVRGPFDAVIELDKMELTMGLHGRYAGRFPIGIGRDHLQLEGTYVVREKSINPTYYGRDRVIDADDPANPLGERWIGLGQQIGLHGTNDPRNVGTITREGSICLGERDIDDVYDILSIGSRIVIRR